MEQPPCLPLLSPACARSTCFEHARNAFLVPRTIWPELVRSAIETGISSDQCPADTVDFDDIAGSEVLRWTEPRALMAKDEILAETAVAVSVPTANRARAAAA
ncbi:MAG: hypothetical protein QUV04_04790 [Synechococcus sp. WH 8007]|nr:hypothetical protein [Synechococcus sp. WH 8007]